jgi:hypothetical protein
VGTSFLFEVKSQEAKEKALRTLSAQPTRGNAFSLMAKGKETA